MPNTNMQINKHLSIYSRFPISIFVCADACLYLCLDIYVELYMYYIAMPVSIC